ncbi:MAG TPA: Carbamoyltransferase HypF [Hyphomicrobiaceae bacterium MAG_BT-2024]
MGRCIRVRGQVQGVGFRPFVSRLANRLNLVGQVLNDSEGVLIHVFGTALDQFEISLKTEAPSISKIDVIEGVTFEGPEPAAFSILTSSEFGTQTRVTPDIAICSDCIAEIFEGGRRLNYAFTNCTQCGPRFTILQKMPYDRARTAMKPFVMCADCRAEYSNSTSRWFHAQPIACPSCGPRLHLIPESKDPIADSAWRLLQGEILAIKGIGGFQLACDATNIQALTRLREKKRRPSKPLALMASWNVIKAYTSFTREEEERLNDMSAPIVLISRTRMRSRKLPEIIAPGVYEFGWILPYTPLHHLLLDAVKRPLVITSGNLSGEPQVICNNEAKEKLFKIADSILMHDRDIIRRLDDSVERVTPRGPMILRRARGRVPETMMLPEGFSDVLDVAAYGAHIKSTICFNQNGQALLSHHIGDLDDPLTIEEFIKTDIEFRFLFGQQPKAVACDLHPDYRSSQYAASLGLPLVKVQHHHAHLAACLGENLWPITGGKVAGIILDGLGLGADGTIWGGELLLGDYFKFERCAWLKPAALPGGDAANREPWRNMLARLDQAGLCSYVEKRLQKKPYGLLRQAIVTNSNAPLSSSAGRLFDAMAAHLDLCVDHQSFEGQAAMYLEALAREGIGKALELPVQKRVIDPAPLFKLVGERANIAACFHASIAEAFAKEARSLITSGEAVAVVLSGGCFQNALLLELTLKSLNDVPVLTHNKVPANDGGLSFGQALIAQAKLKGGILNDN